MTTFLLIVATGLALILLGEVCHALNRIAASLAAIAGASRHREARQDAGLADQVARDVAARKRAEANRADDERTGRELAELDAIRSEHGL